MMRAVLRHRTPQASKTAAQPQPHSAPSKIGIQLIGCGFTAVINADRTGVNTGPNRWMTKRRRSVEVGFAKSEVASEISTSSANGTRNFTDAASQTQ